MPMKIAVLSKKILWMFAIDAIWDTTLMCLVNALNAIPMNSVYFAIISIPLNVLFVNLEAL